MEDTQRTLHVHPKSVPHVTVVAALVWREGQILVQQRSAKGSRPLLWEFPGGKVEAGETDAQALMRECQEEMGVPVCVGPLAWTTQHAYPDLVVELRLYHAAMAPQATPQPLQAARLDWLAPGALGDLPFCEADIPLIGDLVHGRLQPVPVPC